MARSGRPESKPIKSTTGTGEHQKAPPESTTRRSPEASPESTTQESTTREHDKGAQPESTTGDHESDQKERHRRAPPHDQKARPESTTRKQAQSQACEEPEQNSQCARPESTPEDREVVVGRVVDRIRDARHSSAWVAWRKEAQMLK